jgi:imidazolonepropionase
MAMAIACRYQKLLPSEAVSATTVNAAFGIGVQSTRGSIEVGKNADLIIIDAADYRQIAYEFGGNLIDRVVKCGVNVWNG